jgi:hypothetical protein
VNTIEDVQREVDAHVRNGYDIFKFREVMAPSGWAWPACRTSRDRGGRRR